MAVVARSTKRGPVFWVATSWRGGVAWERIGSNRREAERADAARKREVKAGTFIPRVRGERATVATYAETWLARRSTRTVGDDRQRITAHVLSRDWFAGRPLGELSLADTKRLVEELQAEPGLAPKTVKNVWGAVRTMLRDARIDGLVLADVCTLPRGVLRRVTRNKRHAYPLDAVRALMTDERVPERYRVLWSLLLLTGMREGEACGRRWRDWDRCARPLGSLEVASQYGGEPLKTDSPRLVPVHPFLAAAREAWEREGWELYVGRVPTPDDFIVPNRSKWRHAEHHTKSSAYKAWRRCLVMLGIANLSLHSTRNTFITWARRYRADPDAIEVLTHNARGEMIDQYTDWQWEPLCEAVATLPFERRFDSLAGEAEKTLESGGGAGNRSRGTPSLPRVAARRTAEAGTTDNPPLRGQIRRAEARLEAAQSLPPAAWALVLAYAAAVGRRAA